VTAGTERSDPAPGSSEYWDHRYATIGDTEVSWFQDTPQISLDLIGRVVDHGASVVDVGGGASRLVDRLLDAGYHDVTVVDLSQQALNAAHGRLGDSPVTWVVTDIRDWQPDRTFDVWHDRAAYHFLIDPDDQQRYWQLVRDSVPRGGHVIVATFAEDGPEMCSGLPITRYSQDELAETMGEGFTVLGARREEHVTPTGGTQNFNWLLAERT
jgi:SAM-dependent methyltransferase